MRILYLKKTKEEQEIKEPNIRKWLIKLKKCPRNRKGTGRMTTGNKK